LQIYGDFRDIRRLSLALLLHNTVYAPNDISQQIKLYQEVNQTLRRFSDSNLIIGGDFNCALTPKARKSAKQGSNKHAVIKEIGNLCSNFALTDIGAIAEHPAHFEGHKFLAPAIPQ